MLLTLIGKMVGLADRSGVLLSQKRKREQRQQLRTSRTAIIAYLYNAASKAA
jgi:hypothetical protein